MKTLVPSKPGPKPNVSTVARINASFRELAKETRETAKQVREYSKPSGPLSRLGVQTGT